jgi:hypothetical protein
MDDDGGKKRILIKTMGDDEGCHGEGGKIIIKTEDGMKTIEMPDLDIDLDLDDLDLDDLEELHDMKMYHLQDAEDLEDEIEDLKKEIEELKRELEMLKKS